MGHSHHHGGDHQHGSAASVSRKLTIASAATFLFVIVELGAGLYSGSLSLVGDAVHNFTDSLALLLALLAVRIERKPATSNKTYGYHRAGVLTAFINAAVLAALTIFLVVEALARIRNPQPVDTGWMLGVSIAALIMNGVITFSLHQEGRDDVNIRSAVLHMLGDAVSSGGIIVAALLIRFTGVLLWDPAVSILIAVLILWSSWDILRETVNLLLEGTPRGIDPEAVAASLSAMEGIQGVHHLHIWAIGPSRPALSCHLMVGDVPLSSTGSMLQRISEMLEHEFHIAHTTVQFEFAACEDDDPFCIPYTAKEDQASVSGGSEGKAEGRRQKAEKDS